MEKPSSTRRIYCNLCKQRTNHNLIASRSYDNRAEEGDMEAYGEFRLWCRAGCDACTMEDYFTADYMVSYDSEGEESSQAYDSIYYPKPTVGHRPNKHFYKLPKKLTKLYSEVIRAHNDKLHILCAAGLRGLILDALCKSLFPEYFQY